MNFSASGSHQQEISWTSVNPIENASNYRFIGLMVNPNNESTWFDGTGSQPCYIHNITQTSPNTFTGSVQLNNAADWSSELCTTFKMVGLMKELPGIQNLQDKEFRLIAYTVQLLPL